MMSKQVNIDKKWRKSGISRKLQYIANIIGAEIIHIFKKPSNTYGDYWMFGLADDIYANNGKAFYEYMKDKHPEITLFWVCDEDSVEKLSKNIPKGKFIIRNSIKNYLYALDAQVAVYGFSDRDVAPGFFRIVKKHKAVLINVSHGFDGLKGMPKDYYKPLCADIICAASSYEMKMKIDHCGADKSKVKLTGFARYDQWNVIKDNGEKIKKILLMPTWRDWYEDENLLWKDTNLFSAYSKALEQLSNMAREYGLNVKYNFHPRMEMFFKDARWDNYAHVSPTKKGESIQAMLEWADLIITDYSSVFWDALYMGKPSLLFWFDEEEYAQKRGLMVDHSFYPYVFNSEADLIRKVRDFVNNNNECIDYSKDYFNWKDKNNCQRIYDEVQRCIMH